MRKSPKYSPEVIERTVRMVFEAKDQYESQWAAIESIAAPISQPSIGPPSLDTAVCRRGSRRCDAVRVRWSRASASAAGQSPAPHTAELATGAISSRSDNERYRPDGGFKIVGRIPPASRNQPLNGGIALI